MHTRFVSYLSDLCYIIAMVLVLVLVAIHCLVGGRDPDGTIATTIHGRLASAFPAPAHAATCARVSASRLTGARRRNGSGRALAVVEACYASRDDDHDSHGAPGLSRGGSHGGRLVPGGVQGRPPP